MKSWTFDTEEIANKFDAHVREQLPWYDLVTDAVVYIARNYLPKKGVITEVGSSTGNMTKAFLDLFEEREGIKFQCIEVSKSMCDIFNKNIKNDYVNLINKDISKIDYDEISNAHVTILFLTMMFVPVEKRKKVFDLLVSKTTKGGCVIIVDKIIDHKGYFSTVLKRLGMHFKLKQGAKPEEVLQKEMSLAGVQIPIDLDLLGNNAKEFFRMGEFAGWVIEV